MKQTNPLEKALWLLIISVFAISGILAFINRYDKAHTPVNNIIKQTTDDRGLTSVVYYQNGHEFALDYLNSSEYDSLVNVINTK